MRKYIRENLKTMILVTIMLLATTVFITTNELVAKRLPEASELKEAGCYAEAGSVFEYTGNEIEPEIREVVFTNEEGEIIRRESGEFTVLAYTENVEVGTASIEVRLNGYAGSKILVNAFKIRPAMVKNLQSKQITQEAVDLSWDAVTGADGYLVYKSVDNGASYSLLNSITDGMTTSCQDTEIECNTTYLYKICAYMNVNGANVYGNNSAVSRQTTYIATPVLKEAVNASYNTIRISWDAVEGATGYQVYRSTTANSGFECIKEITDGLVNSYEDATCECGQEYIYYIKASQLLGKNTVFGLESNRVSTKTTPNQVALRGTISSDNTQVSLSWKKTLGAKGYEIYRSDESTGNYRLVEIFDQEDVLTWNDSGLKEKTEYFYKVRAFCEFKGEKIYGKYSNVFEKDVKIEYTYGPATGSVSGISKYVGAPYVWGGRTPSGWDCGGFTQWAMKECFGVTIAKSAAAQGAGGKSVSMSDRSQWQPGDILAYSDGSRVTHVAMYIGNGQMIHALNTKYDTLIQGVDHYEKWDSGNKLVAVKRYH